MADPRDAILIVRHPTLQTRFYDCVTDWAREHAPELGDLLQVRDLPVDIESQWLVRLVVMWLQDPLELWSRDDYSLAEALAEVYERRGIPTINRPGRTSAISKSSAAPPIASAGFRVPRMARVRNPAAFHEDFAGLTFPLFVRDDRRHGSPMLVARSADEARALPLETFHFPVAVELIDSADPRDGLFRKFRYFACDRIGVSQHLQVSSTWITRGDQRIVNPGTVAEELDYISKPDRHHERFQIARRALQLDMAAFDYGYDRDGGVVVWEVNPFPHIKFAVSTTTHRNRAIHRSIAAMLAMYLTRAGLAVPESLVTWLAY